MLDPQLIRNNLDVISKALLKRGVSIDKNKIKKIEEDRKLIQIRTEELQSERNTISKKIALENTTLDPLQLGRYLMQLKEQRTSGNTVAAWLKSWTQPATTKF